MKLIFSTSASVDATPNPCLSSVLWNPDPNICPSFRILDSLLTSEKLSSFPKVQKKNI